MSIKFFDSRPRRRTAEDGAACAKTSATKKTLCFTSGVVWGHHSRLSAKDMKQHLQCKFELGLPRADDPRSESCLAWPSR